MSVFQVFYDKLCERNQLFNSLSVTCSNNEQLGNEFHQQANMQELFELAPKELIGMIDGFKDAEPEKEGELTQNFLALPELERKCVVAMMELVVNLGKIENASDLPKREHWFQVVKNLI